MCVHTRCTEAPANTRTLPPDSALRPWGGVGRVSGAPAHPGGASATDSAAPAAAGLRVSEHTGTQPRPRAEVREPSIVSAAPCDVRVRAGAPLARNPSVKWVSASPLGLRGRQEEAGIEGTPESLGSAGARPTLPDAEELPAPWISKSRLFGAKVGVSEPQRHPDVAAWS